MRRIRMILVLALVGFVGLLGYAYYTGRGWALPETGGVDTQAAAERGRLLAEKAVEKTSLAVSDGALTAKIKSKMALDDYVKARNIDVDTVRGVVTVGGTVYSEAEQRRAVQLAKETQGVTQVIDRLEVWIRQRTTHTLPKPAIG